jgi:hypothetical protein
MPRDRTVCPDCRNHPPVVASCATCLGRGLVCPLCRGAGIVSINRESEAPVSRYRACECRRAVLDEKSGRQARSKLSDRPRWRRDAQAEAGVIVRWRERRDVP